MLYIHYRPMYDSYYRFCSTIVVVMMIITTCGVVVKRYYNVTVFPASFAVPKLSLLKTANVPHMYAQITSRQLFEI